MKKKVTKIDNLETTSSNENIKTKINVAAYCRVSTESDEQLNSLAVQRDYFNTLIGGHTDWNYVGIYYDEGISGTSIKNRKGFNNMINDALAGKIDMIIVKSISRFARNTVDALQTIRLLRNKNIKIFFEKEQIDSDDIKSELMLTIMSSLAQEESQSLSENVKWGRRKLMAKGYVNAACKNFLGYDRKDKYQMEINKEQAKTIILIYDLYLHGYSMNEIARMLNENNLNTPANLDSSHWRKQTVASILKNEKYCGDAVLQKSYVKSFLNHKNVKNNGELPKYYVKDNHDAIIPRDTWKYTQEIIEKNQPRSNITRYGFLIYCSKCNSMYQRYQWNHEFYNGTIQCYRCIGKYNKEINCDNVRLLEKQLDDLYHKIILSLFEKYKKDIIDYFNLTLPKVIEGKRRLNKIIKSINNMVSFNQSEYEINSLKVIVEKILVNTDSSLEFHIINNDIIHIQIPKWSIVEHFGRNMSESEN